MTDHKDKPSRRQHERYPCSIAVRAHVMYTLRNFTAEILDIGTGGALIRTAAELGSETVRLEIPSGKGTIEIMSRSVRALGKDPAKPALKRYGLNFRLNSANEAPLRALLDRLRAGRKSGPELKCDYWNL